MIEGKVIDLAHELNPAMFVYSTRNAKQIDLFFEEVQPSIVLY